MSDTPSPATAISSRVVAAGCAEPFQQWVARFSRAAREADGYHADLQLEQPGGLFHLIYQFDSAERLEAWERSPAFRQLTREGEQFSVQRHQSETGEQVHFRIPSEADAPRWKMVLMTWLCVYPLILLLSTGIKALPLDLPLPVELGITSIVMVTVLTTVIVPRVSRLLRPWLLGDPVGGVRAG